METIRRIRLILLILSLQLANGLAAHAQFMISGRVVKNTQDHPIENTYLHLDKPYYAAGDTIYFKAYVTLGERHQLSTLSGILHVDLINTTNKIDQSIKLQLVNGVGWGDFALPDSLPAGNYRIRAYTQWMRNEENYFEQILPVGSVSNQKVPESSTAHNTITTAKPDLQFFPEGGQLVAGIMTKVAFKAIGTNGLGINVKGVVKDNTGAEVGHFVSPRLGMGYFEFKPEDGKTYKAEITFADGSQNVIDLPKAEPGGVALAVNNDSIPKATVTIQASQAYFKENKGKNYTLLIYSGGTATTVNCKLDSPAIKLDILKRRLHTGITRITLFSSGNEALAERLIFVQNYDQLSLNISTDKGTYRPREKANIRLSTKTRADSATMGHFSVSVTNETIVIPDENKENSILADLLLTADLKGTVEQPNYYFTNINEEKLKELDLVMLTHGYRRFEWEKILNNNHSAVNWQPEKSLQVSGIAESLGRKPIPKAPVSLISFEPKSLTSMIADDNGKFLFDNLSFPDTMKFVLQAVNAKGKNRTRLVYNPVEPAPVTPLPPTLFNQTTTVPPEYLKNSQRRQEEFNSGKAKMLKEVKIKAIKKDDQYETQSLAGAGHADQVMHAAEIGIFQGPLSISLNGRLRGVRFYGAFPNAVPLSGFSPMLVVVDGVEGADINTINAGDVETVEVLRFGSASIYGMRGGNGVIVITTKRRAATDWKDIAAIGISPITVQGYYKAREFYSPKYESGTADNHPDLRSTIYWKPEIQTDKDGNASFDYYNADGAGTYRMVIEGIDEKGNLGRRVYRYKVE